MGKRTTFATVVLLVMGTTGPYMANQFLALVLG